MRQMTKPLQITTLSPTAKKRMEEYLKDKEWGILTENGFVSISQLTIGQLIEFLVDHKVFVEMTLTVDTCNKLWKKVVEILNEEN